ncbi:MAG: VWA domain-containing protein [Planctomycetota bacterium]
MPNALLHPWLLALLPLIPLAWAWGRRRGTPAMAFASAPFAGAGEAPLPRTWRVRLQGLPDALTLAGLGLLVVALARPVDRRALPAAARGIEILLCLDHSSSMAARDLDPARTRLQVAQDAARRFVADRPQDRLGLLAFAAYTDVICPLTLDHAALQQALTSVATVAADGPEDLTGIGTAVARAAQLLANRETGAPPVVILLTDGEENVAGPHAPREITPAQAAARCAELGVCVYAVAIGRDALDAGPLVQLAAGTGGAFFRPRDAAALARVYAEIDTLETVELEERRYRIEERFLPVLLAGLALLLGAHLLSAIVLGGAP